MAKQRGMTALQLNLHAELDDKIDFYVDRLQSDIAASGEQLIVDSRLAWFFFRDALKVHLITEPTVAAHRVVGRPTNAVETYTLEAIQVPYFQYYKRITDAILVLHLNKNTSASWRLGGL